MRFVFISIVDIGWRCLNALLENNTNIVGIFTADKSEMVNKSNMHTGYFSEFEDLAFKYSVPLYKTSNVSVPLDTRKLRELQPDIIFCIGWPQIIKKEVLEIPKYGCIGIHPTLLPERRGGAPINWCLIDGLSKSGVSLFYFDKGVDSGDIIAQKEFDITIEDTARTVSAKVKDIAVELVTEYSPLLEKGEAPRSPQDNTKATYTRRRRPDDGAINWSRTSVAIYNWVRALTIPFPGAYTCWEKQKVIIWKSELVKGYQPRFNARPGEILEITDKGVIVTTGDSCILITHLEMNGETLSGQEFAQKHNITPGILLGVNRLE